MIDTLIYGGAAINVIGAIYLLIWAVKYITAYKTIDKMPIKVAHLKTEWGHQRIVGFGLMIGGVAVMLTGCFI